MYKRIIMRIKQFHIKYMESVLHAIQMIMLALVVFLTVWIWIDAPKNAYFDNQEKESIWYGDGWSYENGQDRAIYGEPVSVNEHYLKLQKNHEKIAISKILNEEVLQDKYLCFRVKAKEVKIFVNGRLWEWKQFSKKTEPYASNVNMFYQVSTRNLRAGDKIVIEFYSSETGNFVIEYFSLGNRYSIEAYVLSKCTLTIVICVFSVLLVLLTLLVYYSAVLFSNVEGYKSLWWLISFLLLGLIYLLMDCGYMELWIRKTVLVYWMKAVALLLMPIPLIMYIKRTFYPRALRFDILVVLNQILIIGCILEYVIHAFDLMNAFMAVFTILLLAVLMALFGFVFEKRMPDKEVLVGSVVIGGSVLICLIAYLRGDLSSVMHLFGVSLFIYSLCMLVFTVTSRTKVRKEKEARMMQILAKDKEAAELANEQKTRFLSHMSHEIRTPLNAVLGMNELILRETDEENVRKYANNIKNAGKTLLGLINDVLDFTKIDTGKMEIVETEYSLLSMVNDVVFMVQERLKKKGLELRLDINSSIPDKLMGDDIRVKQIMINLLTNAVKYTEKGWVAIRMWHEEAGEGQIRLIFEIADSGIGIKEEELPRLFLDFERLDQLKNRSIEGTGLGLNITSSLVKMMSGQISVESEYGKGSVFQVVLPQRIINDAPIGDYSLRIRQIENQSGDIKQDNISFGGKKALVVDDNEMNLEVIASILEMMEIEVNRATNGAEALEILGKEHYDIVITDDMMPGMTGTELLGMVKGNHDLPNTTTPMVVLTANAVSGVAEEYMKRGFQDYLTKPIDIEQLQRVLKKFLG